MSFKRFSDEELRVLRNDIPVRFVIESLCGYDCKEIEGHQRFVCPLCEEMRTSLHPRENVGRCFRCERNFNPIEFVMSGRKLSFVESVKLLKQQLSNREPEAPAQTCTKES